MPSNAHDPKETHHQSQTSNADNRVEHHDWAADAVLVADPGRSEHVQTGHKVGRRNEALGRSEREAHLVAKDHGEEVRHGVGDGSQATGHAPVSTLGGRKSKAAALQEDQGVAINERIFSGGDQLAEVPRLFVGVTAISVDLVHDNLALFLGQEF